MSKPQSKAQSPKELDLSKPKSKAQSPKELDLSKPQSKPQAKDLDLSKPQSKPQAKPLNLEKPQSKAQSPKELDLSKPQAKQLQFNNFLAQTKSGEYNRHSINDIETKTANVTNMLNNFNSGKDARNMSQNQSQGPSNNSSTSINNNNQSVTNVTSDFLGELQRGYQQMPSWRQSIG